MARNVKNIIIAGVGITLSYTLGSAMSTDARYRIDRDEAHVYLVDSQRHERIDIPQDRSLTDLVRCPEQETHMPIQLQNIGDRLQNWYEKITE